MSTDPRLTGDLDLARMMLSHDDFLEGHVGVDALEVMGEAPKSEPGTVSVHLNGDVVEALLLARGWQRVDIGRETAAWNAPDGERYWHRDEALTVALTAEVV
jgi:hypothetical protein